MTDSVTSASGSSYLDSLISAGTTSSTSTGSTSSTTGSSTLGESDFLKLLTTQMQTQDPFNPVDNTQMVAQLAQFSSVAGISEMNSSLSSLASTLTSRLSDGASWIGKAALSSSSTATALSDGSYQGQITLPAAASDVKVSLVDTSGNTVYSQDMGSQSAGNVAFDWNGQDSSGATAATGPLTVKVTTAGMNSTTAASVSTWNTITGINSPSSGTDTQLITAAGLIAPSAVLSLS